MKREREEESELGDAWSALVNECAERLKKEKQDLQHAVSVLGCLGHGPAAHETPESPAAIGTAAAAVSSLPRAGGQASASFQLDAHRPAVHLSRQLHKPPLAPGTGGAAAVSHDSPSRPSSPPRSNSAVSQDHHAAMSHEADRPQVSHSGAHGSPKLHASPAIEYDVDRAPSSRGHAMEPPLVHSKNQPKPLIQGGPCENPYCGVSEAPQWRRIDKRLVCNRCGMYHHRHGRFPDAAYFLMMNSKKHFSTQSMVAAAQLLERHTGPLPAHVALSVPVSASVNVPVNGPSQSVNSHSASTPPPRASSPTPQYELPPQAGHHVTMAPGATHMQHGLLDLTNMQVAAALEQQARASGQALAAAAAAAAAGRPSVLATMAAAAAAGRPGAAPSGLQPSLVAFSQAQASGAAGSQAAQPQQQSQAASAAVAHAAAAQAQLEAVQRSIAASQYAAAQQAAAAMAAATVSAGQQQGLLQLQPDGHFSLVTLTTRSNNASSADASAAVANSAQALDLAGAHVARPGGGGLVADLARRLGLQQQAAQALVAGSPPRTGQAAGAGAAANSAALQAQLAAQAQGLAVAGLLHPGVLQLLQQQAAATAAQHQHQQAAAQQQGFAMPGLPASLAAGAAGGAKAFTLSAF